MLRDGSSNERDDAERRRSDHEPAAHAGLVRKGTPSRFVLEDAEASLPQSSTSPSQPISDSVDSSAYTKRSKHQNGKMGELTSPTTEGTKYSVQLEMLQLMGEACDENRDYASAILHYSNAIGAYPENHTLYSKRAQSRFFHGDIDGALVDLRRCVDLAPTWVKGHTRLAAALAAAGKYWEAAARYRHILTVLDHNNSTASAGLDHVSKLVKARLDEMNVFKECSRRLERSVSEKMKKADSDVEKEGGSSLEITSPLIERGKGQGQWQGHPRTGNEKESLGPPLETSWLKKSQPSSSFSKKSDVGNDENHRRSSDNDVASVLERVMRQAMYDAVEEMKTCGGKVESLALGTTLGQHSCSESPRFLWMVESVRNFSHHIPRGLLESLLQISTKPRFSFDEFPTIPSVTALPANDQYHGALLFVDMSGFTALSQRLHVETLSDVINSYFDLLLRQVDAYGGDVLKFAGDAMFAIWSADRDGKGKNNFVKTWSLGECVSLAARCGASIVEKASGFEVADVLSPSLVTKGTIDGLVLDVHCTLGVGRIVAINSSVGTGQGDKNIASFSERVDNSTDKWRLESGISVMTAPFPKRMEFFILGDPIDQIALADSHASRGELASSPEAIDVLCHHRLLPPCFAATKEPQVIATKTGSSIVGALHECVMLDEVTYRASEREEELYDKLLGLSSDNMERLYDLISLYVHPVVRETEKAEFRCKVMTKRRGSMTMAVIPNVASAPPAPLAPPVISKRRGRRCSMSMSFTKDKIEGVCQTNTIGSNLYRGDRCVRKKYNSPSELGPAGTEGSVTSAARQSTKLTTSRRGSISRSQSDVSGFTPRSTNHRERRVAQAELRDVYTIFVKPLISARLSGDADEEAKLFQLLNDIVGVTTAELDKYGGQLLKFIVDDKGAVLIASFGLLGSTFPQMVAERALPATLGIRAALQLQLNVDSQIGATMGKVYCGVVGGVHRHEYSILGPSVNLAARLMASGANRGILVDDTVRSHASRQFEFRTQAPVSAKGYAEPVQIFEPLSEIECQWYCPSGFVGRKSEIEHLLSLAREGITNGVNRCQVVMITGESGIGKSFLVYQFMQQLVRSEMYDLSKQSVSGSRDSNGNKTTMTRKSVLTVKGVCEEGESTTALSVFRSVLGQLTETVEQRTANSKSRRLSASLSTPQTPFSLDVFRCLCQRHGRSVDFAASVGINILNLNDDDPYSTGMEKLRLPAQSEIVDFMTDVFDSCSERHNLTLLAIDDVQWMDPMSWKVVQALFERCHRLMIICISRPLQDYRSAIDPDFWKKLQDEAQEPSALFQEIHLTGLDRVDMPELIARTLGVSPGSVENEVCIDTYELSGGMPCYAVELVTELKRRQMVGPTDGGTIGWQKDRSGIRLMLGQSSSLLSLNGLLLLRLDGLTPDTRNVLQICALLGYEFCQDEVLKVYKGTLIKGAHDDDEVQRSVNQSLVDAVQRGILFEALSGGILKGTEELSGGILKGTEELSGGILKGSEYENDEDLLCQHAALVFSGGSCDEVESVRSHCFTHSMWRKIILDSLLDERKCDISMSIAKAREFHFDSARSSACDGDAHSLGSRQCKETCDTSSMNHINECLSDECVTSTGQNERRASLRKQMSKRRYFKEAQLCG